ncbi:citrate/H+ symporter, CitMHS family [Alkaliphilus metalliredigens QYMF]|uniref:Citrate/H+ symporter, CitMHS family n=1 Tax=Alkaliphilus metalliredigens (strain QYMF) TaxID=293826 RepID=A6TT33_ALKMQ|nr:citrate:proton symporter [Alkaliphilus metalliredigens]ABR49351.1 citrate/H+ symporter, CitMHS family [Alkaliphilus metalliredigens QYMF]
MLSILGFLMVISIIVILLKGKMSPIVVLILVPLVAALIAGFGIEEIGEMVKGGIGTVQNNSILFIFSIIFFGLMSDVGVFDGMVSALVKRAGNNVVLITVATGVIATIAHLDGATATTVLVTVPAMYPIYKKMNIRPQVLILILASAMGVMNLLPWGGPVARSAVVLGMDANDLWLRLIPLQVLGVIFTLGLAAILGIIEKKKGAGISIEEATAIEIGQEDDIKGQDLKRPKLLWFNLLLTVAVIGTLVWDVMPAYLVFMIGLCLGLVINFPSLKAQDARIKAHAPAALVIAATMLAAGVMVGIMDGTGMLEAMAGSMLSIVPDFLGRYVHLVFGVIALPLGMMIGTDAYFYGLMPLVLEVGSQFGVEPFNTATTMLVGKNISLLVSPIVPATFLALGLVDLDLKDHMKFSFKWLYGMSILMLIASILIGLVHI